MGRLGKGGFGSNIGHILTNLISFVILILPFVCRAFDNAEVWAVNFI